MQKLQDSVFSIIKSANLSPAVFSYLQPSEDSPDKTPLGGILRGAKHGWLALGPRFCVVDLRSGLKVAARTFGALSNYRASITSVVELPTPLTENTQQLVISLECEENTGLICVFHINGSQLLKCIQTEIAITQLAVCDGSPNGPFSCFDGVVMAGTKNGEIIVFDLNRASLMQALKDILQGYEQEIRNEDNPSNIAFLPLTAINQLDNQRDVVLENDDHIAVLLNENSLVDGQYIFRNPDGTVRMKAKRDHIRVTVLQYIPQLGSMAVGFNFGAFQIWNIMNLDLEFTSQVNVECLPVTHFGFQEPCDDPRAFCYLWVVFSVMDRFEEEEFPLAVMYSLTYQGKRMLSDTKCLYQEFLMATIRFQVELSTTEENAQLVGGRCISCHTYSVNSTLGGEGEDSMLNICQLVWECWGDNAKSSTQHGLLLFDLDQWYKDQMPATYQLQSNAFMSATCCTELCGGGQALDVAVSPGSVAVYCARAPTRLEEHFYPNSLHYNCICLTTSECCVLSTIGIQRQIINSMDEVGPTALLNPTRLYNACVATGLTPLYMDIPRNPTQEEQRRYLLSVALEARLSRLLARCARDWAAGTHSGAGCTLPFLVDWCWNRAIELKENAKELTAPLFTSSALPDRNVVRCLEHCVQQLTQLTGLLDAVLTKCCNLVVPDALSEMEEKYKGIGTVALYFRVIQWLVSCGLLPERGELPFPAEQLVATYTKRRLKLHRLQDHNCDDTAVRRPCGLLYIDQLIEHEFGGERIRDLWLKGGSECHGLYPPPSLYSLLRLYLLPDVAEEHKHSLVLYLLVDYSMVYDELRYEAVIRRLMQFPTMFGLSNTAIKATQAFWHLDHRDFDFALDQLQCLTGNTLSEWQHNVVLSSLLAQNKTQAALQYLHVRKPPPIQSPKDDFNRVNDHDKLDDWQSCCNLYLARGLVFEALDVIRMCVQNAGSMEEKTQVLVFFFRGCRNTGNLAKVLQITLMPFEEEVFIKYLEDCNESQTSDILIMYYLQQARYLEAEFYNNKIKTRFRTDLSSSVESVNELGSRASARDLLVSVSRGALPPVTSKVATCAMDMHNHVIVPKPMSVYVTAKSPKNTFTYKSTFIQDTIESASETWLHKPKLRKGLKRALNIEETPFICTPKLSRTKSFLDSKTESTATPSKRPRLDLSGTPKTPAPYKNETLSKEMSILLEMPDIQSPSLKLYDRGGAETPHSILKTRSESALGRPETASPVDSRYLPDSDEELLETGSNHTHYSDSTNKQLRFIIPHGSTATTPSPETLQREMEREQRELERDKENRVQRPPPQREWDVDMSFESCVTTTETHAMSEPNPMESPPKRFATSENVRLKKIYKDTVKARRSFSISANSSLSDDPNTSIESIADIPVTLINPRYSGERRRTYGDQSRVSASETKDVEGAGEEKRQMDVPRTPRGRRSIRATDESTPLFNRSRSATPERQDSPIHPLRMTRSRSRTPEVSPRLSPSPLITIPEQPKQEVESEPHPEKTMLSVSRIRSKSRTPERKEKKAVSPRLEAITESKSPESSSPVRSLRSRSRTPERKEREKLVDSPRLEAIKESSSPDASPVRRSLRSRSRTPEVEMTTEESTRPSSPRALRSRAKTPEKLMSPKKELPRSGKKSLSRIVLEANAFAKTKQLIETGPIMEIPEVESETPEKSEESQNIIECTPMKPLKPVPSLMDVTISPIASKSVLQSSSESIFAHSKEKVDESPDSKSLLVFTISETKFGKSVLKSFNSTAETTELEETRENKVQKSKLDAKSFPVFTLSESCFEKSVLKSYQSSIADTSSGDVANKIITNKTDRKPASTSLNVTELNKSVLRSADSSAVEPAKKATDNDETNKTLNKDVSSLITDDSEIELKEEGESNAAVIQKEKEKIVEIEREINEIEGDMLEDEDSDVLRVDTDSGAQSDESEPAEGEVSSEADSDSEDEGMEEDSSDEDEGDSGEEDENSELEEVISINDSESNDTNNSAEEQDEKSEEKNKEVKMEVETEKDKITDPTDEESGSIDPLNQAQCSIMTDDNSVKEAEQTMNLNYSDEIQGAVITMETDTNVGQPEAAIKIGIVVESNPEEKICDKNIPIQTQDEPKKQEVQTVVKKIDVVDSRTEVKATVDSGQSEKLDIPIKTKVSEDKDNIIIEIKPVAETGKKTDEKIEITTEAQVNKREDKDSVVIEIKPVAIEENVASKKTEEKITTEARKNKSEDKSKAVAMEEENVTSKKTDEEKVTTEAQEKQIQSEENKDEKKTFTRRKRAQSVSSVKSTTSEGKKSDIDEPRTTVTRKRSLSVASTQSTDQKTPEKEETTPNTPTPNTPTTRRRAKTPTSAEVRKILTRRASKELSEKADDPQTSILEDSMALTPKRRSTRSRSKNQDDDVSIASGSSVRSTRSRASEDAGDKPQVRKGRKSIVATKPDLSVIPESIVEESKGEVTEEMMEYSTSRRLTRHQKAVMESFTQPSASPRRGRRGSVASKSSVTELQDDDDASSTHSSTYDPHVADRIALLNKGDFEGSTESSEPQSSCTSPLESIASDASKQRRARIGRAASESRTTPKLTKISRRISVDVVTRAESPAVESPATRARRASFNRACEALHTPKGRRASTDVKKGDPDTVSQSSSPSSEGTATRRGRRASTQSAASDTANRSRNV